MTSTLIIRHLPICLDENQRKELLFHFGAKHVRCMSDLGPLRHVAFATFSSLDESKCALSRLHQLEVLGSRLVVEYAKEKFSSSFPTYDDKCDEKKESNQDNDERLKKEPNSSDDMIQFFKSLHSSINGAQYGYPTSPLLKYDYPPASPFIVQNISQALLSVPKFYVQVLHLMNKMNLPPPFIPSAIQPVFPQIFLNPQVEFLSAGAKEDVESEIESDEDDQMLSENIIHEPRKKKSRPRKRPRLEQLITCEVNAKPTSDTKSIDTTSVFEISGGNSIQKKIEFNLTEKSQDDEDTSNKVEVEVGGFGKIDPSLKEKEIESSENLTESGYMELSEYISDKELLENKISAEEMKKSNLFKRYEVGEATTRLYLKNLPKQLSEQDILYVYGRYVDWKSSEDVNVFDIRLMKEGRMKGQAFITFSNELAAKRALNDTNGYRFHGKPVIVQFARSAKPKLDGDKSSK